MQILPRIPKTIKETTLEALKNTIKLTNTIFRNMKNPFIWNNFSLKGNLGWQDEGWKAGRRFILLNSIGQFVQYSPHTYIKHMDLLRLNKNF